MAARLAGRPGLRELLLFGVAYLLYSLGRFVAIGDVDSAQENTRSILQLEEALRVDVEQGVQDALDGSSVLWLLNHLYLAAQLVVVPGALIWLFRRSRSHYELLRNTVLATWLIALPVYALFPVAPPRLADMGLVDTITTQTGVALDSKLTTSMYNEYAAVPSLHAGFALAVSIVLGAVATRRRWRILAWSWAPLVSLSVVATGNHFVTDIAAGLLVTAAGFAAGGLSPATLKRIPKYLLGSPACPPTPVAAPSSSG